MERKVNALIEESAMAAHRKNFSEALTKAKDAGKQERLLCKHREASGQIETINLDLTYAVCFNLATMYHSALPSDPARAHDCLALTYTLHT